MPHRRLSERPRYMRLRGMSDGHDSNGPADIAGRGAAIGLGGVAGGVTGAGALAAAGFAVGGPPGAAIGFLVGLFGGTMSGGYAGKRLYDKVRR